MVARFYLCGPVRVEVGPQLLAADALRGRQDRVVLAVLVLSRARSVSRDELCDAIWPDERPRAWSAALSALVSNLRGSLARLGLAQPISTAFGCHQLCVPPDVWVDVDVARAAVHDAEVALARGDLAAAFGPCGVSAQITSRPFLVGEYGPWVESRRRELEELHLRALECVARFFLGNGEHATAVDVAGRLLDREPLRETGYQIAMRAHNALGNRAEALAVYAKCRARLREDLGVDPSAATKEVYRAVLRAE